MSGLAKAFMLLVSLTGLGVWGGDAQAATRYARASTAWNLTSTWSTTSGGGGGASVPVAGDTVFIGETSTARNPTIPAGYTAACATLNIGGSGSSSTLTLSANTSALNVSGNITINRPTSSSRTVGLNVNAGTVNVTGSVVFAGTNTTSTRDNQITITTGSLTIGGDLVLTAGVAANNLITMSGGAGTLNLAGNFTGAAGSYTAPTGTLAPGATSTFNFNGSAIAQTIPIGVSSIIYHSIFVNNTNAGGATLSAAITGTNVTGDLQVQGGGILNDGGFRIVSAGGGGVLSVANGATLNLSYSSACPTLTISGFTTKTFGASSNTDYLAGANQCISAETYGNLTVSGGAGAATLNGATTVAGFLTLAAGDALADGGFVLTANGDISNAGSHTGAGSITLSGGAVAHDLSGNGSYSNLILNDTNGATLSSSPTVSGTLTLTTGKVTTGGNTLITTAACNAPSVARTGGWVDGTLRKAIPAGASTCNFEVGDATNYTPVSTTFIAGTTAGNLTASTVGAQHPSIASSDLDTSRMVNRYWTLTNGGVGGLGAGYSATFNFINPGDLTAGANTANFEVENWSGAAWSVTTAGARNTTNTTATGLTAFGAFAVGEKKPTTVVAINCSVSCAATSAATVLWTVTFSRSVAGVDAAAFTLAPTGLTGAYITSVTGAGATWTVIANTGIGSGTLGLNQTGPGSVVPALSGTFPGEVYTISATPALAEYRMDEASWNGTVNEAIDSGVSGSYSGTAAGLTTKPTTSITSPAIAGSPGTCRYGVFNRSNKDYIALPGGFPNLAAAADDFTITAWINVVNNTLPGQRIFIDDENNTSPGGWGFSVGETSAFGVGGLRFYYRQPSVYILDTVPIPSNQWLFVALSVHLAAGANASSATIYAWNTAGTLVTSNTGTFTWSAGSDPGPSSIGGETNASGEGTNAFGFGGDLDELRVYQKVLSQSALAAIAMQTHACSISAPDHLLIQSSGSGLTCAASTLTVVACQDASCATPYTLGVGGTLSATGTPAVNWDDTTGGAAGAGFVIPAGSSSVTKNVQVATAGSVVFGVSSVAPTPINSATCNFGSPVCTFTANAAGFIFSDTATPGNSYTISPQISGIATPTLYLRAVQASTVNPAVCTPAIINQTTAVNMGYTCNDPATCQAGSLTTINATAVAPGGTSVNLTFDVNGSAPITARYDDAGQITLDANKTVTPFGGATAVTLNGSSNAYVVAPHHFGFSGIPAGPFKAGSNFAPSSAPYATVTAYNGLATPAATANFGKETSAEGVTLSFTKCQPTGTNSVNGAFSGSVGAFASGVANATSLNWSEVGNGDLVATLTSGSYLGSSLTATGNTGTSGTACNGAGNVGRFIPDHFDTVVGVSMTCPAGLTCPAGGLVYSGQPFTINVYARNAVSALTQNYDGTANTTPNFAQAVTLTAWDALGSITTQNPPALTPGSITGGSGTVAATSFDRGSTVLGTPAAPIYTFGTTPTSPTDIYIRAADADATSLRVPAITSVEGGIKVVNGRVRVANAYGSELLPLTLTATAQYYTAGGWVNSITDSVTNLTLNASYPVGAGSTTVTPLTGILSSGRLTINLSAPGVTGSATINPTAPGYLPVIPGAATFGVYKGNNIFIYMREAY